MRLAASLDQGSEHPLAQAIVEAARAQGLPLNAVKNFESGSGIGVRGEVDSKRLVLGNTALMEQERVDTTDMTAAADSLRAKGASVMFLAADGRLMGLLAVSDPIKKSTPEAVQDLHDAGIRVIMATGDGVATAHAVARQLNIDEVYGEVKPADKLDLVTRLQQARVSSMMGVTTLPKILTLDCRSFQASTGNFLC